MQRLLVVAAFYIVVLQAVLVYTVPAARDAGLSALAAGATFFAIQVVGGGGARRLGPDRRSVAAARRADADARRGGGRRRGRRASSSRSPCTPASRLALPAAVVFGFGALGWNGLVYVSAGERTPPELVGPVGRGRGDGDLRSLGGCDAATRRARARRGWDVFWLATAALALAGAAVAATLPATVCLRR